MDVLLSAFIAVLLTEMGGKVQANMRALAGRFPAAGPQLLGLVLCSSLASLAVGAAGGAVIADLVEERARLLLVAIALLFAATVMIIPFRTAPLPERSGLLAVGLPRLIAAQLGDASQFLVFALAAWSGAPFIAALAGTMAVVAAAAMPLALPDAREDQGPVAILRRVAASGLFLVGIVLALTALRLI
jgi:Ca2+/H+ antiporter, TMEM165/GDT1 family